MNLLNRVKALVTPTVDTIVADFAKAEKRLQALTTARLAKASALHAKANQLIADAATHTDHAVRAASVAKKLGALLH